MPEGYEGVRRRQGHAPRRPGPGAPPPRRRDRGSRRLPRGRPRPRPGPRGPRPGAPAPPAARWRRRRPAAGRRQRPRRADAPERGRGPTSGDRGPERSSAGSRLRSSRATQATLEAGAERRAETPHAPSSRARPPAETSPRARRAAGTEEDESLMLLPRKTKYRKSIAAAGAATRRASDRAVRRLRAQGARGRLDHEPPDRGCPYRDDAQDQARRQGLDQRLPGQAVHARSPPRRAWAPARARPRAGSPWSSPAA